MRMNEDYLSWRDWRRTRRKLKSAAKQDLKQQAKRHEAKIGCVYYKII